MPEKGRQWVYSSFTLACEDGRKPALCFLTCLSHHLSLICFSFFRLHHQLQQPSHYASELQQGRGLAANLGLFHRSNSRVKLLLMLCTINKFARFSGLVHLPFQSAPLLTIRVTCLIPAAYPWILDWHEFLAVMFFCVVLMKK